MYVVAFTNLRIHFDAQNILKLTCLHFVILSTYRPFNPILCNLPIPCYLFSFQQFYCQERLFKSLTKYISFVRHSQLHNCVQHSGILSRPRIRKPYLPKINHPPDTDVATSINLLIIEYNLEIIPTESAVLIIQHG